MDGWWLMVASTLVRQGYDKVADKVADKVMVNLAEAFIEGWLDCSIWSVLVRLGQIWTDWLGQQPEVVGGR
jgi:hypothetical protein